MRTTILTLAAAAALALAGPAAMDAQGPPKQAQKQQAKAERGNPGERASPAARAGRAQASERGQGQGQARGQGQGQSQGQQKAQGQARGQGQRAEPRPGNAGRGPAAASPGAPPGRAVGRRGGPAPDRERFHRNLLENALRTRATRRGDAPRVRVSRDGGEVRVQDDGGRLLFALAPSTVDDLGYWRAAVVPRFREDGYRDRTRDGGIFGDPRDAYPDGDAANGGSPAFCRSGEGHPVWGRDWCIDKGFGLGDGRGAWGIDRDIEDIILRRPDARRGVLDRGGLVDVLGDVVFGRLAVQSLVLGAEEPLTGRWLAPAEGPLVLRVQAGDLPVAELVDYDRDDRVDTILFNLGD